MTSFRRKRLGEILMAKGLVTEEQINGALAKPNALQKRIGELLIEEGLVSEESVAQALAEQCNLHYVDLKEFRIKPDFFKTVPVELMQRFQFVPVEDTGEELIIAIANPCNLPAIDELERILKRQFELCVRELPPSIVTLAIRDSD